MRSPARAFLFSADRVPRADGAVCEEPTSYDVNDYQEYLHKNPYGYRCHTNTGVRFPESV